ncbi:MAG: class I SAM-dependent methyltransferase [Solirubrobacterales bacterium]|nr:class I SAM-dependent methyltransferase [Solirubrobacterales bacterium]
MAWDAVADAAGVGDGTSLLDLGCGDGAFCAFAAERGAVVHGVDAEPDALATALQRVPGGDFRLGMMESLPWDDASFDVVTSFNGLQYALDPEIALLEAARVARIDGRIAVCKWGPPASNEFFGFLVALGANGVRGEALPATDPVEDAIRAVRLDVAGTGDVDAPIEMADDKALAASLQSAGVASAATPPAAAARRWRRADGSYRFENRLRYWLLRKNR